MLWTIFSVTNLWCPNVIGRSLSCPFFSGASTKIDELHPLRCEKKNPSAKFLSFSPLRTIRCLDPLTPLLSPLSPLLMSVVVFAVSLPILFLFRHLPFLFFTRIRFVLKLSAKKSTRLIVRNRAWIYSKTPRLLFSHFCFLIFCSRESLHENGHDIIFQRAKRKQSIKQNFLKSTKGSMDQTLWYLPEM